MNARTNRHCESRQHGNNTKMYLPGGTWQSPELETQKQIYRNVIRYSNSKQLAVSL